MISLVLEVDSTLFVLIFANVRQKLPPPISYPLLTLLNYMLAFGRKRTSSAPLPQGKQEFFVNTSG